MITLLPNGFALDVSLNLPLFLAKIAAALAFAGTINLVYMGFRKNDVRYREYYIYGPSSFSFSSLFKFNWLYLLVAAGICVQHSDLLLQQGIGVVDVTIKNDFKISKLAVPESKVPNLRLESLKDGQIDMAPLCSLINCPSSPEIRIANIQETPLKPRAGFIPGKNDVPAVQISISDFTKASNLTSPTGKVLYHFSTRGALSGQFLTSQLSNLFVSSNFKWSLGRSIESNFDQILAQDSRLSLEAQHWGKPKDESTLIYLTHSQLISFSSSQPLAFRDMCIDMLSPKSRIDVRQMLEKVDSLALAFGHGDGEGWIVLPQDEYFETIETFFSGYQLRCVVRRLWVDYGNGADANLVVPITVTTSTAPGQAIYISPLSISMNPALIDMPNITLYTTVLTGYLGKDAVLTEKMFGQWAGLYRSLFSVGGSDIDIEYVKQTKFVSYWCFALMCLSIIFYLVSFLFTRIDEYFTLPISDLIGMSRGYFW